MDNSVNKLVENPADNLVGKSVHNPVENPQGWYDAIARHLCQFHQSQDADENNYIYQFIIKLGQALQAGHTCLPVSAEFADLTHPLLVDESAALATPAPLVRAGDYVYFYRQWQQEYRLAEQLVRLLQPVRLLNVQSEIDTGANALQQQAIALASRQSFSLITGGPGTGKTYTLVRIVRRLQQAQADLRIALAAPTGKAAQRMQSVLNEAFSHENVDSGFIHPAQTVHRLLGLGGFSQPRYHAYNPLPYDLIILDEGSMLDLELASQFFAAIRAGTRVIILGDADQLAAVEAGAVLSDLQQAPALADYQVQLKESRRFNATQGIGSLAHAVLTQHTTAFWQALQQEMSYSTQPQISHQRLSNTDRTTVYQQLWQGYTHYVEALLEQSRQPLNQQDYDIKKLFAAFDQYRILSAMRSGDFGVDKINRTLSLSLQQAMRVPYALGEWFQGRPIMMNRNDYGLQLSNGDIGICLKDAQNRWQVYFPHLSKPVAATRLPLQDISTAFALTIHKSQGSEFEHVAVVLEEQAQRLLSRELLYTAMTRAKNKLSLWGESTVINLAILKKTVRYTGLSRQIQRQIEQPH